MSLARRASPEGTSIGGGGCANRARAAPTRSPSRRMTRPATRRRRRLQFPFRRTKAASNACVRQAISPEPAGNGRLFFCERVGRTVPVSRITHRQSRLSGDASPYHHSPIFIRNGSDTSTFCWPAEWGIGPTADEPQRHRDTKKSSEPSPFRSLCLPVRGTQTGLCVFVVQTIRSVFSASTQSPRNIKIPGASPGKLYPDDTRPRRPGQCAGTGG